MTVLGFEMAERPIFHCRFVATGEEPLEHEEGPMLPVGVHRRARRDSHERQKQMDQIAQDIAILADSGQNSPAIME